MARRPRIEYEGAVYHVINRGDRKNDIYRDDRDREIFLDTLSEACERQGWLIHAYVLMRNHYHLLLETPEPNLVGGMKWLQGTYTQRFNNRHKECGHLFQGRYKALIVQSKQGDYFATVASYIHLNPVRARLLDFERKNLTEYRWSSFPLYFDTENKPDWLCVSRVLDDFRCQRDKSGLHEFSRMMMKRSLEIYSSEHPVDFDKRWQAIRSGWCLGDDNFRGEMEQLANRQIKQHDRRSYLGDEARRHDELEAERLLNTGLDCLGVDRSILPRLKKNDVQKKVVAWLIRQNTSVRNEWICEKLSMGRPSNLARHVKDVSESTDVDVVEMRKMMKKAF